MRITEYFASHKIKNILNGVNCEIDSVKFCGAEHYLHLNKSEPALVDYIFLSLKFFTRTIFSQLNH